MSRLERQTLEGFCEDFLTRTVNLGLPSGCVLYSYDAKLKCQGVTRHVGLVRCDGPWPAHGHRMLGLVHCDPLRY